MKVLHLTINMFTGGAQKLLLDMLPKLNKETITSDLYVMNSKPFAFMQQAQEQKVYKVFTSGSQSVYHIIHIFKLIPFFKKYDVLHVHLFPAFYFAVIAKIISFSKIKLVYTEHSVTNKRRNNWFFRQIEKFFYKAYHQIICISDEVKMQLQKDLNIPEGKLRIIINGINIDNYRKAKPYDKSIFFKEDITTVVIQVASFIYPKDPITLIRSFKYLPDNYGLLLVGIGKDFNKSVSLVNELRLENRIKFLRQREDVPALLKTANTIVLSSLHEGLSLSCIEAMASKRAFIATNSPGIRDVVEDGAILVPQKDAKKLAETIQYIYENKTERLELIQRAKLQANKYDINEMRKSYYKLYKQIVSN